MMAMPTTHVMCRNQIKPQQNETLNKKLPPNQRRTY